MGALEFLTVITANDEVLLKYCEEHSLVMPKHNPIIFLPHSYPYGRVSILFSGFIVALIVMMVMVHFFKKRIEKNNQPEQTIQKKSKRTLLAIIITILTVIISIFNFMVIQDDYNCVLYSVTHLILILSLYTIIMNYMYVRPEKALKNGEVLLTISSVVMLSDIILFIVAKIAFVCCGKFWFI